MPLIERRTFCPDVTSDLDTLRALATRHLPTPSFHDLRAAYLKHQRDRDHAPKTLEKYDLVLRQLCKWASHERVGRLSQFTEDRYWAFHRWMVDTGLSDKTRYDRLIIIKQAFK